MNHIHRRSVGMLLALLALVLSAATPTEGLSNNVCN